MAELPAIPWETSRIEPQRDRSLANKRSGFLIDLRRCVGCHACSVACKTENDVPLGAFRTRVRYLEAPAETRISFLPLLCMHCQDAPCLNTCPTEAITRLDDGRVVVDQDKCCGNKTCIAACPYGAIYTEPTTGKADKCDMCTHRTSLGMEPACVASCPTGSLRFGDLDAPEDPVRQYAQEHNARPFKEDAGTRPSVVFIGLMDWMEKAAATGIQLSPDDNEVVYEQMPTA